MMLYTKKVMEHFTKPQNVGKIEDYDGIGIIGNPKCGDTMEITIKVKDNKIADIKFRTFGCASAIATSSITTVMAKGLTLDKALLLTRDRIANELDGLPPHKMHCSNLAVDALKKAIEDSREKSK